MKKSFDIHDPDSVSAYDDLPLRSASFGLLLLDQVPLSAGVKVLETGCGTGVPLIELAERLGPSSECRRVLKPGGTPALTSNLVGHMKEFYDRFEKAIRGSGIPGAAERSETHISERAAMAKTVARIEAAGLKVTKQKTGGFQMRFSSGSALFAHPFIRLAFMPASSSSCRRDSTRSLASRAVRL